MTDVYAEEERLRSYLTAEEEDFYVAAEQEYYDGLLNSMTPHERKHALKPSRMDRKGGHTHNHVRNCDLRLMYRKKKIRKLCRLIRDIVRGRKQK